MKRIHSGNVNTPEFFNKKFNGTFGLHDMKRMRALAQYYTGGIYIDVGCMDSPMPALLAETHDEIYALDFANEIVDFLKERFPKVHYQTIESCYALPFDDGVASYIVAGELIEHLEDPKKFVDEALRVLKPGGILAVSTPFEELVSQGSIGGKQHLWSFNLEDMETLFGEYEHEFIKEGGGTSILIWKRK